jgi:hypothetical protein
MKGYAIKGFGKATALALVSALCLAGIAYAKKATVIRYGNTVTITLTDTATADTASGAIKSNKAACIANRPIGLYRANEDGSNSLLREVRSKADGSWTANVPGALVFGPPDRIDVGYFAVIGPKRIFKTRKRIGNCAFWNTSVVSVAGVTSD